jgi:hypothetical protein
LAQVGTHAAGYLQATASNSSSFTVPSRFVARALARMMNSIDN